MKLVIINGYAASGKSTLSMKFAKNHDYALLKQDTFLFDMNPASLITKKPHTSIHQIALKNMLSVMENYFISGKDVLIEGALVSITDGDPIDISAFVDLAKKYNYETVLITLIADDKIRKRRQKKRGNTLNPIIDKKLVAASDKQLGKFNNHKIDTSKQTIRKSLEEIEKIVGTTR